MDLISYRGPGVAGGVSSGLGAVWVGQTESQSRWYYINKEVFEMRQSDEQRSKFISMLPESMIDGHYRYCNELIWPLMHDLPEHASYSADQHYHYNAFNKLIAEQIDVESPGLNKHFVQDYQLALVPQWLNLHGHHSVVFWHIPWPKNVPDEFVEPIKEIALGLLGSDALGFHTEEYAKNFLNFVEKHIKNYRAIPQAMAIINESQAWPPFMNKSTRMGHKAFVMQEPNFIPRHSNLCQLVVHPLGIDFKYWQDMKETAVSDETKSHLSVLTNTNFILSVDRVDYTKAVFDRILLVDKFFRDNPEMVGKVTFAQVSGRSRAGLPAFDKYWNDCKALYASLNNNWKTDDWQPLVWIDQPLKPSDLAYLYRHAKALMVNAVRDGLNLTAKEYVACQENNPGVLLLSPGAGAWDELGDYALPTHPKKLDEAVQSILKALSMPLWERHQKSLKMKTSIAGNQLTHWWDRFSQIAHTPVPAALEEVQTKPAQLG